MNLIATTGKPLVYMQARFNDPQVGRFLSTDPVHFDGKNPFSFNRYKYGNNNPYRYVDPTGMTEDSPENLKKRENFAASAEAQPRDTYQNQTGEAGDNKCSTYVNDKAAESGMPMSVPVRNGDGSKRGERPPTAGEMANKKGDAVKDWRRLGAGETPKRGDAAAYKLTNPSVGRTGHAGIITGGQNGAPLSNSSAHAGGVYTTPNQFEENSPIAGQDTTYLRYTGD